MTLGIPAHICGPIYIFHIDFIMGKSTVVPTAIAILIGLHQYCHTGFLRVKALLFGALMALPPLIDCLDAPRCPVPVQTLFEHLSIIKYNGITCEQTCILRF